MMKKNIYIGDDDTEMKRKIGNNKIYFAWVCV